MCSYKSMRILCAAIRHNGIIYKGKNHYEIGSKMVADGICTKFPGGDDQGFVTECGMYVRREPALMIAIKSGQVKEGETFQPNKLFSEDLK